MMLNLKCVGMRTPDDCRAVKKADVIEQQLKADLVLPLPLTWQYTCSIFCYGPNRCEDPKYVIGTELSPAVEADGRLEVGKTPYLPYVFWSTDT